jgi:hypothetical protein
MVAAVVEPMATVRPFRGWPASQNAWTDEGLVKTV